MKARRFSLYWAPLAVLALAGCGDSTPDRATMEGSAPQKVNAEPTEVKAEVRDVTGYEFLTAKLFTPPESQAFAMAPMSGPVSRILTSEGQKVRKGEVLAELGVDTQLALQQFETDLQAARTAYAQAESQMGNPLRSARLELEEARATERQIRERTLPGGDATELTMAREARQAAQQEVDRLQAELNTQLLPYLQSVQTAEENLKRARLDAKLSTVDAPISGTVTRLMVQPGANVTAPNTHIAEIVDLDDLTLIAEVQPNQHKIVEDSDHVYIRFNEFPDKVFDGHVINVQALPSREGNRVSHEAKIDFTNDEGVVKPNMTIRSVGIVLGRAEDVVGVPVGAVDRDEAGKAFVMVKTGAEWVRTPVELGLSDGDYVEVKSGVKKDEVVQVVPGRNEVGPTAETLDS